MATAPDSQHGDNLKKFDLSPLASYFDSISNDEHRQQFIELCDWLLEKFPQLEPVIKWNQPMFLHHGTFIIGFTVATHHINVGPEPRAFMRVLGEINTKKIKHGTKTYHQPFDKPFDYALLERIVSETLEDKREITSFWDHREFRDLGEMPQELRDKVMGNRRSADERKAAKAASKAANAAKAASKAQ